MGRSTGGLDPFQSLEIPVMLIPGDKKKRVFSREGVDLPPELTTLLSSCVSVELHYTWTTNYGGAPVGLTRHNDARNCERTPYICKPGTYGMCTAEVSSTSNRLSFYVTRTVRQHDGPGTHPSVDS